MLFDDSYFTIENPAVGEFRDRGSKFIAYAFPLLSENDFRPELLKIKKEHPQAVHHCYAYRITTDPGAYKLSDDREPSGSAGKPILGAIQSKGLTNTAIVVVRYFGGTLLGIPGLINAYRSAALAAIESSKIIERTINSNFIIRFPYDLINEVHLFLKALPVKIKSQEFGEPCELHFEIRISLTEQVIKKHKEHPQLSYLSTLENY